jgi:methyl-accepting chemotaxis protein
MAQQIVPVWERQLQSARGVAEEGLGNVMQHLGGLSESLAAVEQQVLQIDVSTGAGAADEVLGDSSEALQALQAPAQRAFNERDQSLALLQELREPMSALTQLVLQLQTVAAHTRLVSMNASIEASRNSGDGGTRAVAEEVRAVAARIGDSATLIAQRVTEMDQSLLRSLREGELLHTSGEELRLELQLRAREALERMLGSLGAHLGGSHALHASCEALRAQSEQMLMSFQFGDRLNQMLGILGHDMERFIAWIAENRPASHVEAAQWLSDLEASYTTDEQRARHHDNVHVQRSNNVEFF